MEQVEGAMLGSVARSVPLPSSQSGWQWTSRADMGSGAGRLQKRPQQQPPQEKPRCWGMGFAPVLITLDSLVSPAHLAPHGSLLTPEHSQPCA